MIPYSWIADCLQMFDIADNIRQLLVDNIRQLLVDSMKQWRTEVTSFGEVLVAVSIRGGIFQEYSLPPLLFVVALIPLSLVLRKVKSTYEFSNKEKINHLIFNDDVKLLTKSEKGLDSLVQTVPMFC